MCSICMVHEGYVARLHVTIKNDKHKIHKIHARQYRNTTNNYGFPTINLLKSTCFNRLLNNDSRSVETISSWRATTYTYCVIVLNEL